MKETECLCPFCSRIRAAVAAGTIEPLQRGEEQSIKAVQYDAAGNVSDIVSVPLTLESEEVKDNQYSAGSYIVVFFSREGQELSRVSAINWQDGVEIGRAGKGEGSFNLLHVVYSSADAHPTAVRDLEEWEK